MTINQDVTHLFSSTAEAVSKVKGKKLSQRFRDMFFPGGRPLRSGSFLRMPGLAAVLEAGLANFYDGNFSQEIVDVVNGVHILNSLILWYNYAAQSYTNLGLDKTVSGLTPFSVVSYKGACKRRRPKQRRHQ